MSKMTIKPARTILEKHFNEMVENFKDLFTVSVDKNEIWELFQSSFPDGENDIFQKRRRWDCACCKHFFNVMANVVAIDENYNIVSIWDVKVEDEKWQPIFDALSNYIHSRGKITEIFRHWESIVGTPVSRFEFVDPSDSTKTKIGVFDHFWLELPDKFIIDKGHRTTNSGTPIDSLNARIKKDVFKRGLEEFTMDALSNTLDMICANNLYKGEEWKNQITEFKNLKEEFDKLPDECKDNYAWKKSCTVGNAFAMIRNTSIGALLIDLSEAMDIEKAVKKYEKMVAPENYRRSMPVFTKKMLEDAKNKLVELGLEKSLGRRFAVIDDISVNDILYANRDAAKKMKGGSVLDDVFEEMSHEVASPKAKEFIGIPEIHIEQFVLEILPDVINLEAYVENRHNPNMVSLIAPIDASAAPITKWENNFSWAYAGNITDSLMKERVKSAGGFVDGDLRFSIQWNDNPTIYNGNDFDAHCVELTNNIHYEIYYGNKRRFSPNGGMLDVDIINPELACAAVENIIYPSKDKMQDGIYRFYVMNYSDRGGIDGFSAEIEFDGTIHSYQCRRPISQKGMIIIADVILKNGIFTIDEKIGSQTSSKEIWGITTNNFVPVSTVMYSPNYWNQQKGIGHKHYFFMLQGCKNPDTPNGFYNEFLRDDLREHRKVFEALGSKMMVNPSDDQLSGLGFSSTRRNDLVVRAHMNNKGETKVIRIKF